VLTTRNGIVRCFFVVIIADYEIKDTHSTYKYGIIEALEEGD
jgi:hypothetical protein